MRRIVKSPLRPAQIILVSSCIVCFGIFLLLLQVGVFARGQRMNETLAGTSAEPQKKKGVSIVVLSVTEPIFRTKTTRWLSQRVLHFLTSHLIPALRKLQQLHRLLDETLNRTNYVIQSEYHSRFTPTPENDSKSFGKYYRLSDWVLLGLDSFQRVGDVTLYSKGKRKTVKYMLHINISFAPSTFVFVNPASKAQEVAWILQP